MTGDEMASSQPSATPPPADAAAPPTNGDGLPNFASQPPLFALPAMMEPAAEALPDDEVGEGVWPWIEARLEAASEWLNPILVKEARQALKSLQFVLAFGAVLVFAYGWSLLGLATTDNGYNSARQGPQMLMGYCVILAFPLLVIIPFTAFRSLAVEREDGTYDLLCVTTLGPEQIVFGKLTSAIVQMLVYFSAVSPCIAFTYLLPGNNIVTIGLLLGYMCLASILFSTFGLLLATATKAKHWQVVLSILVVLGLFGAFVGACNIVGEATFQGGAPPVEQPEFWAANAALMSAALSFSVLFVLAAAAQISFASDNHSTRLRSVIMVQTGLLVGFSAFFLLLDGFPPALIAGLTLAGIVLSVLGALMMGESGDLSPRARRELPQTLLGRVFLTWLNPGGGTGYVFILANMGLIAGLASFGISFIDTGRWGGIFGTWGGTMGFSDPITLYGWFIFCYMAIYLGLTRFLMLFLNWSLRGTDTSTGLLAEMRAGPVLALALCVVLVLGGVLIPLVIQLSVLDDRSGYTLLQLPNPFWTLGMIIEPRGSQTWFSEPAAYILGIVATGIVLVNLPFTFADVLVTREDAPDRVREEEALLAPPPHLRKGPFEDREFTKPAGAESIG